MGKSLLKDNKVYLHKRCPEHGPFEALIYGDAQAYVEQARYNKPGSLLSSYNLELYLDSDIILYEGIKTNNRSPTINEEQRKFEKT